MSATSFGLVKSVYTILCDLTSPNVRLSVQTDRRFSLPLSIPSEVKLYPDPAQAAVKAGDEAVFRVWAICRDVITQQGTGGWIAIDDVLAILAAIGLSRTAWYHLLTDSAFPVYFSVDPQAPRIFLTGLEAVCVHYGCTPHTRPVYVPLAQFHRLRTFRAAVHAAQFDGNSRFIGRKHMQDLSGISPSAQRRYEAETDVEVTPTFVFAYADTADNLPIPDSMAEAQGWNFGYTLPSGDEVYRWQNVNSYRTPDRNSAPRGMAKKITKCLNARFSFGETQRRPRYFVDKLSKRRDRTKPVAIRNTRYDLDDIGYSASGGAIFQHLPGIGGESVVRG